MKVLDLRCSQGHGFEGWFGSSDDFESQLSRGLVECPICSDRSIVKLLSAPRLNFGSMSDHEQPARDRSPASASTDVTPDSSGRQAAEGRWLGAMRKMLAETEDVGTRFPDEARRIHHGEAPERSIRGHATPEQAEALRDEGIPVMAIALPDALKQTLQ